MSDNLLILGGKSKVAISIAKKFASKKFNIISAGRNISSLIDEKQMISDIYKVKYELTEFDILKFDKYEVFYNSLPFKPSVIICVIGSLPKNNLNKNDFISKNKLIQTNFIGPSLILEFFAEKYAVANDQLSIIGISSVAGDRGRASNFLYGSAKSGFTQFLSGLRQKYYRKNIHVLTIIPGFIDTAMLKGINAPSLLISSSDMIADKVYNGYKKRKMIVYSKYWKYIMIIIKIIPEFIFKRLNL